MSEELEAQKALIAAEALCTARGGMLNAPGRRVLRALLAAERPLKAYDLIHILTAESRSAAPPTVYRALTFLTQMGLAHRVESQNAYVACRFPAETHVAGFRVCPRCGAAEEFKLDPATIGAPAERIVFEAHAVCAACEAG